MTVARGLVANARNAFPSFAELEELAPAYVASIVYGNDDIDAVLQNIPPGVNFIARINAEHEEVGSDWSGWESAIQSFAYRFRGRVWGVEMTTEWDAHGMSPREVADLVHVASPYLQEAGMVRIVGGVDSPDWQPALINLANEIEPDDYDFGGVYPYGQYVEAMGSPQPGFGPGLAASVTRASSLLRGKPVCVIEFGAKIRDYGGEERQAEYVTEGFNELDTLPESVCSIACFFAFHDAVGAPFEQGEDAFGLMRWDGSRRPAWDAYRALTGGTGPDPCLDLRERLAKVSEYVHRTARPSRKKLLEMIA